METKGTRTKNKICRISANLFSEKGYKDVSMQDICDATGLSKGGLYRHFSSKSEILLEILKKERKIDQQIEEGQSAVEILNHLIAPYYQDMIACRHSLAYALFEYAASEPEHILDSTNSAERESWHRLVEYGVKTGEFNNIDPDIVMDSFLYAYRGVMMWGRVLPFDSSTLGHILESVRFLLIKDYGKDI